MASPSLSDNLVLDTDRYHYEGQGVTDSKKRQGRGVCTWKSSGHKYEGEWKDDKMSGQGVHTWPSGQLYEGEWKDGKSSGQGVRTWPSGALVIRESS